MEQVKEHSWRLANSLASSCSKFQKQQKDQNLEEWWTLTSFLRDASRSSQLFKIFTSFVLLLHFSFIKEGLEDIEIKIYWPIELNQATFWIMHVFSNRFHIPRDKRKHSIPWLWQCTTIFWVLHRSNTEQAEHAKIKLSSILKNLIQMCQIHIHECS